VTWLDFPLLRGMGIQNCAIQSHRWQCHLHRDFAISCKHLIWCALLKDLLESNGQDAPMEPELPGVAQRDLGSKRTICNYRWIFARSAWRRSPQTSELRHFQSAFNSPLQHHMIKCRSLHSILPCNIIWSNVAVCIQFSLPAL
jgi:hypothetical protein